jgi:hypothetical protein
VNEIALTAVCDSGRNGVARAGVVVLSFVTLDGVVTVRACGGTLVFSSTLPSVLPVSLSSAAAAKRMCVAVSSGHMR